MRQDDLTARTLAEQLQQQQDEILQSSLPGGGGGGDGKVKVSAQFWNSSSGQMESTQELTDAAKRKGQINALATSAAAMEVEQARQRQAGYAKRDTARKKYGW